MNPGFKVAMYAAMGSFACGVLAVLETMTGIVSWMAPTEAHAFGWLAIGLVCATIVRSYMQHAIRLPSLRNMAMPRAKQRYAHRTRRYI